MMKTFTWRMSALGRERPVVTVCDFFSSATCYADTNGRVRPGASISVIFEVRPLQDTRDPLKILLFILDRRHVAAEVGALRATAWYTQPCWPSASGRKQPVPIPSSVPGVTSGVMSGRGRSQLFRYPCRSVAAIQLKIVAAISKIRWAKPGTAAPCVASISESHGTAPAAIAQASHPAGMPAPTGRSLCSLIMRASEGESTSARSAGQCSALRIVTDGRPSGSPNHWAHPVARQSAPCSCPPGRVGPVYYAPARRLSLSKTWLRPLFLAL
jgi:hypothetical protein